MPRVEDGWTWVRFQATEQEKEILDRYSAAIGRTKTEILREYVRSLPSVLPEGWYESEFDGRIEGSHEGYRVAIYPDSDGWVAKISGDSSDYKLPSISAVEAITLAKALIDA